MLIEGKKLNHFGNLFALSMLFAIGSCDRLQIALDPVVPVKRLENEPALVISMYDAVANWRNYKDRTIYMGGYFSAPSENEAPILYSDPNSRDFGMVENGYQLSSFEESCDADFKYLDGKLVYVTGVGGRLQQTLWHIVKLTIKNPPDLTGISKLEIVCK